MSGIAVFLPNEIMCRQAKEVLARRKNHVLVVKATTIDNVVDEARRAIELGANIAVARGHQAGDVKLYTGILTVEMVMTAQELGLLVIKAKEIAGKPFPKIGIFCWKGMLCDTTYFGKLYGVEIAIYYLESGDDWFEKVEQGIAEGIDVLIGGEKCVRYAQQKGFPSVFLSTTGESIELAINQAETLYEMAEMEKHSYAQFSTVLDSSSNGIVKIGTDGQIQDMNRVMEEMLNTTVKAVVGADAVEILPFLDREQIKGLLAGEEEHYSTFVSNERYAMVVIAEPIAVEGQVTGAIISCNRIRRLDWSEDRVKEKLLAGFVAQETLDCLLLKRPGLKEAIALAKIYAQSNSPVLVGGGSGEEMERLCQGIHNYSLRKNGPYVVVNAGNVPEEYQMQVLFGIYEDGFDKKNKGAVAKADEGTLVICEIDRLTPSAQRYLFMVMWKKRFGPPAVENESARRVNVRVLACAGRDLRELVRAGKFRKDLYCLIRALGIRIPVVSGRRQDVELLLDSCFKKYLERHGRYHVLMPAARELLLNFPWEDMDVQIDSFCERMVLTATKRRISADYVQELLEELYVLEGDGERGFLRETESLEETWTRDIREALVKYKGNRSQTARELGISTSTLWRYMKKYHIG